MHSAMLAVDGLLGAAPESGRTGWQTLNAYVDGELSAAESAEVARALAEDPALVDQVASLTRLKAAVQDGIEEVNLALPRVQRRTWRPTALAASLAAVRAVGWMLCRWRPGKTPNNRPGSRRREPSTRPGSR
jgi:anti-sigma factor RsiW